MFALIYNATVSQQSSCFLKVELTFADVGGGGITAVIQESLDGVPAQAGS